MKELIKQFEKELEARGRDDVLKDLKELFPSDILDTSLTIRLSSDEKAKLLKQAEESERNVSNYVRLKLGLKQK